MMVRMQISLPVEDQRRARTRAAELGVSFAEYVRRLIAGDLGGVGTAAETSSLFDLGATSGSDVARDKRRYLGEALEAGR